MCEIIYIYIYEYFIQNNLQINNNLGMHKIESSNDILEVKITHDGPYQK